MEILGKADTIARLDRLSASLV